MVQAQQITMLNEKMNISDINHKKQIQSKNIIMENTDKAIKDLCIKFSQLEQKTENDNLELTNKPLQIPLNSKDIPLGYEEYLKQKFSVVNLTNEYLITNLTEDLIDFKKLSKFILDEKIEIINIIIRQLKELSNEADFILYGSYATGLALDWSDVDLLVIPKEEDSDSNKSNSNSSITTNIGQIKYKNLYNSLMIKLQNSNWVESVQMIEENLLQTKIKVVVAGSKNKPINFYLCVININSEQNDFNYIKSTELMNKYLQQYDKVLLPLILALKQILYNSSMIANSNTNVNMNGGMSSFALSIIVISFLDSYKDKEQLTEENLGKIFVDFLQQYSNNFENNINGRLFYLSETEMSANRTNFYNSELSKGNREIVVVNPCDWSQNLTDKTYRFQNIKLALMISLSVGKDLCECSCHYKNGAEKNCLAISKKKHCVLNKMFKAVKRLGIGEESY